MADEQNVETKMKEKKKKKKIGVTRCILCHISKITVYFLDLDISQVGRVCEKKISFTLHQVRNIASVFVCSVHNSPPRSI